MKDGVNEEIVSVDEKLVKKNAKPEGKGKKRRRILFKAMFVMSIISIISINDITMFIFYLYNRLFKTKYS